MPRWLQGLLFFVSVFVVWGGTHVYLYFRIRRLLGGGPEMRWGIIIVMTVLAASYFLARMVDAWGGRDLALPLYWMGGLWMGFVGLVGVALVAYEIGVTVPTWIAGWTRDALPGWAVVARTWGLRIAFAVAALGLVWGVARVAAGPFLRTVEVAMPGLPERMDGFTLVQVTDVHVGELVGPRYLARLERAVAAADGDRVVITGDLSDEGPLRAGPGLARLAALGRGTPVIAITGNHERYAGGEAIVRAMRDAGLDVLREESRVIDGGLVIAGIDDPAFLQGGRDGMPAAMERAVAKAPAGLPVVLLSHQPLHMEEADALGVDLMLCGHTHGGQLPPFTWLNRLAYPIISGEARVGGLTLVTSNGSGWWGPPVRVFADAEVVRVVLRAVPPSRT